MGHRRARGFFQSSPPHQLHFEDAAGALPQSGQGFSRQGLRHPLQYLRRADGATVAPTKPHAYGASDLWGEDAEKPHGLGRVLPCLRL